MFQNTIAITCALTGAQQGKAANPNIPEQPSEIIEQGLAAWRAGASILHLHARDRAGKATSDVAVFREIVEGLRAGGCDAIFNLTTGGAVADIPLSERLQVVPELQPELATFSCGSGALLGRYDKKAGAWTRDQFVPLFSSFAEMVQVARLMRDNGTKPEIEIYHAGMLNNLRSLIDADVLVEPLLVNFVMGIPGEISDATVRSLSYLKESLPPARIVWHVSVIGARDHFRIGAAAALLGGNVRVGMEDNLYVAPGEKATSNAQLVEKIVRILRELEFEPATPVEARQMLGLS